MPRNGKKFSKALEGLDPQKRYGIEDAVNQSLHVSFAKFDESVDVAIRLGVDPKYSDQMVRGAVTLPHGLGKTVRVAVFCKGEKQTEAREAGADAVGAEELVAKIKEGWREFDAAVATPDVMALVGQIGRLLGPHGLMPNAKTGSVTFEVGKVIAELKAGRVEFRVDKGGVLHAPLGKVSFGAEKILGNLKALLEAVTRLKPSAAKGVYMYSMAVSTTMGPGFKIDMPMVKKFLEG
ncbi:50S ribosomal protein L1 [Candidatus Desulfovibrio trichonymphae]|uniref:Large ribosomal subunit protein uL1 n=1 Tax=Candidatus Desulfovibrio trichonymphae TaxID=1725232 RepID=A0A1J1DXI2_9BACT|nr:50S ribosomal protein L1 [Candidatus Desulfovibrio trichonymphae]BAV91798.1 50S ribosomal protein L1 [Candidatus Desulfovibrio trichonymphae]GHU92557.1 50S ribosomal protein L1 [Deltaproteobacteria bacterium]GHU93790.1 50S ribosomal protein L1 [Deltaproteobacteria bacterium]GHU97775.1 50S ribosomal protein L1 [Deltaproteobacteria bacterium]